MASLHRHRTQFGCLDLQTGAAVHGQDLARAGLAAALARGTPDAVYRWSERARAQALLLPAVRPPGHPAAAAALEELRQARHTLRARELAGRPVTGLRARIEALQRSIREQSWTAPGQRDTPVPAPAPLHAIRDSLAGAALVTYLRDGPVLRALVVAGDRSACGRWAATRRRRRRCCGCAPTSTARRAARCTAGSPPPSGARPGTMPPRSAPLCSARCCPTSATATWSWCRPAS